MKLDKSLTNTMSVGRDLWLSARCSICFRFQFRVYEFDARPVELPSSWNKLILNKPDKRGIILSVKLCVHDVSLKNRALTRAIGRQLIGHKIDYHRS